MDFATWFVGFILYALFVCCLIGSVIGVAELSIFIERRFGKGN